MHQLDASCPQMQMCQHMSSWLLTHLALHSTLYCKILHTILHTIILHVHLQIRHDNTVTWLAFWHDPVTPSSFKYVWLAANSSFKSESDQVRAG
jgi:hypothetical protein